MGRWWGERECVSVFANDFEVRAWWGAGYLPGTWVTRQNELGEPRPLTRPPWRLAARVLVLPAPAMMTSTTPAPMMTCAKKYPAQ